jgi:hypothetical protein
LIVIVVLALSAGGYYWYDNREPESIVVDPSLPVDVESTDGSVVSTDPPSSLSGTVAPPISVHSDTLGDVEFDQLLDDWTAVDAPSIPEVSAEVRAEWVQNSRIQNNLPDGVYWGFLHSVFDEEERGFNFDVVQFDGGLVRESEGDQLYPAFIEDLLYASVVTDDSEPGEARNAYVSSETLWNLANGEQAPDGIDVRGWYLLTIIEGHVVAAEGAVTP